MTAVSQTRSPRASKRGARKVRCSSTLGCQAYDCFRRTINTAVLECRICREVPIINNSSSTYSRELATFELLVLVYTIVRYLVGQQQQCPYIVPVSQPLALVVAASDPGCGIKAPPPSPLRSVYAFVIIAQGDQHLRP